MTTQKTKYENKLYDELREYVRVNHGWGSELSKTDLYKEYIKQKEFIRDNFNGKRVSVVGVGGSEFFRSVSEKVGRIKVETKESGEIEIKFYEGKRRTRYNILDLGLFEGFYAVVIVKQITELKGGKK